MTKSDARLANLLSHNIGYYLRRDHIVALPVLHYMNDVIYYIADDIHNTMQMHPHANSKNMLYISGTNYFPCPG